MIDTLVISRRLRDAGASEPGAEAVAKTFAESIGPAREEQATKHDLETVTNAIRGEFPAAQASNKVEFADVRGAVELLRRDVRADIIASQNRILVAVGGMVAAAVEMLLAVFKAH